MPPGRQGEGHESALDSNHSTSETRLYFVTGRLPAFRVQLFLTLNDFAGRNPFLDAFMRGVYVATIPLLAVVLLGLLILAPRGTNAPSRGKLAWAIALALGSAALLTWGVEILAQSLDLGTISPRPFMTRWVNLLIVEPQDNSFPCVEVMVAVILSVGIWAANRRWGVFAALATLMLMAARLFCGSNYGADVGVAAALGLGLMWLCMALCHAVGHRKARGSFGWAGAFVLGATTLATFIVMTQMPRFAGKLQLPWGLMAPATVKGKGATRAARNTLQEGEGVATMDGDDHATIVADEYAGEAESQALSKRATLFLPKTEAELRRQLAPKALPFVLLDVEVAPVTFKDGSYRAAALRFEIDPAIPNVRALVAQRAAALVKGAFAADAKLDNVDITGVVTGDAAQTDDSLMNFAGDEVPVFTASVQRRNLIVKTPIWANDPTLEGGLWLRTRSRLWIDDKMLPRVPDSPQPMATPTPNPTIAPTPGALSNATPKPTSQLPVTIVPPIVNPTISQNSTAAPTAKPSHSTVIVPTPTAATATPQPKRTPRITPRITPQAPVRRLRPRARLPRREPRRNETVRRPRRNIERNIERP